MALTYSEKPQDMECPTFELMSTDGKTYGSSWLRASDKPFLVTFICNHCPYVQAIENRLIALGYVYQALDLRMVAISSNDAQKYPEDSFENMKKKSYPFPYLYDESQEVARAFGALCTPEFYLFHRNGRLVYRGRLDNDWKNPDQVTRFELLEATAQLLTRGELSPDFKIEPSMGCSIKWKS